MEENAMRMRDVVYGVRMGAVTMISVAVAIAFLGVAVAFAADIPADSLKLAPGVVKAPGYETPPTSYIIANVRSLELRRSERKPA
jgi:hypothetical protein